MSEHEMAILPYQLAIFPVVFDLRKSDTLSPVIFLKKRLKVDKSSKPSSSLISLALLGVYSSNLLASDSIRS